MLLNRRTKRSPQILAAVSLGIVLMRVVDLFWIIVPHHAQGRGITLGYPIPHWMDIAAIAAIGGIWIWWFIAQLRKTALVPINDPRLAEVSDHA